ncbi:MAG: PAS domain-containing protein [Omnitrophica WOR_2 bacterium]
MPPEAKIYPGEGLDGELQRLAHQLSLIETHLQAARSVYGEDGSIQKAEEALHEARKELDKHKRKHKQAQQPRAKRQPEQEQKKEMLQKANEFKQREDLLQAILENVPAGLAVFTGPDLVIQFANRTYRSFTPNHQLNPFGRRFEEIWPASSGFQIKPLLLRVMETRETIQSMRHKRKYANGLHYLQGYRFRYPARGLTPRL